MVTGAATYSVVVPVRDEAEMLRTTIPALLAATAGDGAEIVYVCNGCSDDSANLIRLLAGPRVRVAQIAEAGKTKALNTGDAMTSVLPRFYVDADVVLHPGDLRRLAEILQGGDADMVSPLLDFDLSGTSPVARAISKVWLRLPYVRHSAFQNVIGLSRHGRSRWDRFPDILGDDIFMAAMGAPNRGRIVDSVTVLVRPPADFRGWVRTRARWRRGERELLSMGLSLPRRPGQRMALLRRLARPGTATGAACFIAARVLGDLCSRFALREPLAWRPERMRPR